MIGGMAYRCPVKDDVLKLRVRPTQLSRLNRGPAQRRSGIGDSTEKRIGYCSQQGRTQTQIRIRNLIHVDRRYQIVSRISHIPKRGDDSKRHLSLDVRGPLRTVWNFLLSWDTGYVE